MYISLTVASGLNVTGDNVLVPYKTTVPPRPQRVFPFEMPSVPGYISQGQCLRFATGLNSGAISQSIVYPMTLTGQPNGIACEIRNDIDDTIYGHSLSGVNSVGFTISFSDALQSSGYVLYTTVTL